MAHGSGWIGVDLDGTLAEYSHWKGETHIGRVLPITNIKDYQMIELWDDRAVQVIPNTGQPVTADKAPLLPL